MWEPGTAPPGSGKKTPNKQQSKKTNKATLASSPLEGTGQILASPADESSSKKSTTPKRLSGATMNMRFMKRKEETRQQEKERERRRRSADGSDSAIPVANNNNNNSTSAIAPAPAASPLTQPGTPAVPSTTTSNRSQNNIDDAMEVDEPNSYTLANYQVATPVDMYGMQASLIGRRSFGGFNAAMEDAWKESKASLEDRSDEDRRRKTKVSDEELIQRYQDIVKKRSESSRPVGNLRDKAKTKRQRR